MAFDKNKIIKLANLPPATLSSPSLAHWEYVTTDSPATVKAAGYFNSYRKFLSVGDVIEVVTAGVRYALRMTSVAIAVDATVADLDDGGLVTVAGQRTTVAAVDTIVTGLTTVVAVVATFDDDLGDNPEWVTTSIGNQAGAPAAGSFYLKTWQNTAGNDPTPIAATTFAKKVNWVAVGYR